MILFRLLLGLSRLLPGSLFLSLAGLLLRFALFLHRLPGLAVHRRFLSGLFYVRQQLIRGALPIGVLLILRRAVNRLVPVRFLQHLLDILQIVVLGVLQHVKDILLLLFLRLPSGTRLRLLCPLGQKPLDLLLRQLRDSVYVKGLGFLQGCLTVIFIFARSLICEFIPVILLRRHIISSNISFLVKKSRIYRNGISILSAP